MRNLARETGPDLFNRAVAASASEDGQLDHELILRLGDQNFAAGLQKWALEGAGAGWWRSLELESVDFNASRASLKIVAPWELLLQEDQPESERRGCPFLCGKLSGVFSLAFGNGCRHKKP